MEIIIEIIIYLLVVLGLITVCFTFFNKFNLVDTVIERETKDSIENKVTYVRERRENEKITVNVRYKNISEDELEKVKESIQFGKYSNINDIVDSINYIDSKSNKSKR